MTDGALNQALLELDENERSFNWGPAYPEMIREPGEGRSSDSLRRNLMRLSRREFIKVSGAAVGALLLPSGGVLLARAQDLPLSRVKGMLVDLTKCIGCGWCQEACKRWNDLPKETHNLSNGQTPPSLSAKTWTLTECREVEKNGELHRVFAKRQCMHCLHPACASACPVGALQKAEQGAVVYDPDRCIGCRYCMMACPFEIPRFEWEEALPRIRKCTFCADRQEAGLEPGCAEACPTGALYFGKRDDLIVEAETRIQGHPEKYVNHIYGKDELGGTSWMYLSPVPFEKLGFPTLSAEPVTRLSETVATYGTPSVALSVASLLGGLYYWFTRRENGIRAEEAIQRKESGTEP